MRDKFPNAVKLLEAGAAVCCDEVREEVKLAISALTLGLQQIKNMGVLEAAERIGPVVLRANPDELRIEHDKIAVDAGAWARTLLRSYVTDSLNSNEKACAGSE